MDHEREETMSENKNESSPTVNENDKILTFVDDENTESYFEVIDSFRLNGIVYLILLPQNSQKGGAVLILKEDKKVDNTENNGIEPNKDDVIEEADAVVGNSYLTVDSEEEYLKVYGKFQNRKIDKFEFSK